MKHEFEREFPMISAHYMAALSRFMQREGVATRTLLDGTGVPIEALQQPEIYLSVAQVQAIIEQACRLVPRESLGYEFGRTVDLSVHGLLGFSILRRERLRELVSLVVNLVRVRFPLMEIRLVEDGPRQHMLLEETWELGAARHFVTGMYMGGIQAMTALATRDIQLTFDHPAPRDLRCFTGLDRSQLAFGAERCSATLTYHQRAAWQEEKLAPELIARLGATAAPLIDEADVVLRLRQCIMSNPGRECSLEWAADQLAMSARSLRRHLQDCGQSFTDIRNCIRLEFARRLLRGSSFPIEDIAARVGYGDQASFSKAFNAWTGTSPGRYRREGGSLNPVALVDPDAATPDPAISGRATKAGP